MNIPSRKILTLSTSQLSYLLCKFSTKKSTSLNQNFYVDLDFVGNRKGEIHETLKTAMLFENK